MTDGRKRRRNVLIALAALALLGSCKTERPAPTPERPSAAESAPRVAPVPKTEPGIVDAAAALAKDNARLAELEPQVTDAETASLVRGDIDFAFDLYRRLRREPGNVALSPFSLADGLAWVSGGARGETLTELRAALRLSLPEEALHRKRALLREYMTLRAEASGALLDLANGLWVQRGYPFQRPFLDLSRTFYGAEPKAEEFRKDPEGAPTRINAWVADKTRGRIRELFPSGAITPLTAAALVDAVYFEGEWAEPFDAKATRSAPFCLPGQGTIAVQMMRRHGRFDYAETKELQLLALPYRGDELEMVVVLPVDSDGLSRVEKGLGAARLAELLAARQSEEVDVSLPRFDFTSGGSIEPELLSMGMKLAFDADAADFRGIADAGEPLFLSAVFHGASVAVDEKGTVAAAASGFGFGRGGLGDEVKRFAADHPFLFLIREKRSGAVLFLGAVVNPEPSAAVAPGKCTELPLSFAPGSCSGRDGLATVRIGTPEVTGTMAAEVVRRIVRRHLNEVDFCYERELAAAPDLSGRLKVDFVIAGSGEVESAKVAESTAGSLGFEECIAEAFRRWTFPPPEDGLQVSATLPIELGCGGQN